MVLGRLEAINLIDLEMRLKRMDLDFINGDPVKQGGPRMKPGKITRQELINFCFHLEQLARAGVALIESLTDLRDTVDNPALSRDSGRNDRKHRRRQDPLASHGGAPARLLTSVDCQPDSLRRGNRRLAASAGEPSGVAQMAG
jgi:hypothetical protein